MHIDYVPFFSWCETPCDNCIRVQFLTTTKKSTVSCVPFNTTTDGATKWAFSCTSKRKTLGLKLSTQHTLKSGMRTRGVYKLFLSIVS